MFLHLSRCYYTTLDVPECCCFVQQVSPESHLIRCLWLTCKTTRLGLKPENWLFMASTSFFSFSLTNLHTPGPQWGGAHWVNWENWENWGVHLPGCLVARDNRCYGAPVSMVTRGSMAKRASNQGPHDWEREIWLETPGNNIWMDVTIMSYNISISPTYLRSLTRTKLESEQVYEDSKCSQSSLQLDHSWIRIFWSSRRCWLTDIISFINVSVSCSFSNHHFHNHRMGL